MSRYYRSKSRLARTQSRQLLKQALVLIAISLAIVFGVIRFGVPLLIKVAVLVSDQQSGQEGKVKLEEVMITPVLQTLPEATFSANINVLGFAQQGLLVSVFVNGNPQDDVVAGSDGEFELRNVALRSGKNRLWAVARDKQGNKSDRSKTITILSDRSLPVITLDSPVDGEVSSESRITVKGLIDEKAEVMVNGQFALQRADNSFSKAINLEEGENVIEIFVEDPAGNTASKQIKVTYSP